MAGLSDFNLRICFYNTQNIWHEIKEKLIKIEGKPFFFGWDQAKRKYEQYKEVANMAVVPKMTAKIVTYCSFKYSKSAKSLWLCFSQIDNSNSKKIKKYKKFSWNLPL